MITIFRHIVATAMLSAVGAAVSLSVGPTSGYAAPACEKAAVDTATAVVNRWKEAAGRADVDGIAALYTQDAIFRSGADGASVRGAASIARHLAGLVSRHPMSSMTQETILPHGCKAASSAGSILLHVTGRRKGTRMLLEGQFSFEIVEESGRWLISRHELSLNERPNRLR